MYENDLIGCFDKNLGASPVASPVFPIVGVVQKVSSIDETLSNCDELMSEQEKTVVVESELCMSIRHYACPLPDFKIINNSLQDDTIVHSEEQFYSTESNPCGRCVIFNNIFEGNINELLNERFGTDIDA